MLPSARSDCPDLHDKIKSNKYMTAKSKILYSASSILFIVGVLSGVAFFVRRGTTGFLWFGSQGVILIGYLFLLGGPGLLSYQGFTLKKPFKTLPLWLRLYGLGSLIAILLLVTITIIVSIALQNPDPAGL